MEKRPKKYYQDLEKLLTRSLDDVRSHISEQDFCDIQDYIEHGEYGVGWELLWHLAVTKKINITDDLIVCGQKMGFDVS